MNRTKRRALVLAMAGLILAAAWVLPPVVYKARHLCPVRPSAVPGADALPFMARKYRTSCMTCHEMMPRLNAFGEAVRLNGLRWPDKEDSAAKDKEMRQDNPVSLGNEAYKKAFPNAVWPSDLPGALPVSFRVIPQFTKTSGIAGRSNSLEFEIEGGGAMGENVSSFGHFNLKNTNNGSDPATTDTMLVGFLNVENLFHSNHLLNLQLGTVAFEESDYNFYRNHNTQSLITNGAARPFAGTQVIPYPANFSKADKFKLKRGPGAMLWGFTDRSNYAIGYREGDQDGGGSDMNVGFFQAAYKFGGMDHFGRTNQHFDQGYEEDSFSVGVLADAGSVNVRPTAAGAAMLDTFWRAGGDVMAKYHDLTARAGGVVGGNQRPYGTLDSGQAKTSTWFGEADYHWYPWLLTEVRYEEEYISVPAALNLGKTSRGRWVPLVAWLYGPNLRFQVFSELFSNRRRDSSGNKLDPHTLTFAVDYAF